jgi:hypothetical protein
MAASSKGNAVNENVDVRPSFAMLRTQLPYVDRRSLSEAWFSALHLVARDAQRTPAPHGASGSDRPGGPRAATRTTNGAGPSSGVTRATTAQRYASALAVTGAGSDVGVRDRASTSPVSHIGRAVVRRPSYSVRHTSLTLDVDGSRVALMLRREGNVLHVIALCRPDVATLVSRALARADAHLRRGGDTVRASVRTMEGEGGA